MKKYEQYSIEELQKMCDESESYREVALKIGYSSSGGGSITIVKQMIIDLGLNCDHFKGQGHTKNIGKYRTQTEDYITNKVKITTHKLRLRLLEEGIFEPICNCCKNTQWLNQSIPLELHHKNGNKEDNELSNLELLCPNCHYFTDTYKTKNWDRLP